MTSSRPGLSSNRCGTRWSRPQSAAISLMAQDSDDLAAIARQYERFAICEARGSSPIYERLALAVSTSSELLTFSHPFRPGAANQNLFLAAVRNIGGLARDGKEM